MTFAELVERWKQTIVPTLKQSTADLYAYKLERYVVPVFGTREVTSITRYEVETFLAEKARMYCRNTIRAMRASLSRVLSWAVACDWIAKNPCSGVALPFAKSRVKRTVLTPEQVGAIAARLKEPYATLVLFLAGTGLRVGEAVGIKWSDFDGTILHVQRRIYEGREGTTKTRSSERSIPISSVLIERMKTLGDGEWVFRSRNGTPVDPKNIAHRYLRPVARELGIPLGGWHDFRHTLSTRLLREKHPAKLVAELLGHSDVRTTLAVYHHVATEELRVPLAEIASQLLCDVTKSGSQSAARDSFPCK
ncbi:MAG TPA: tyrosine-type recombinase/integrase [Candidatus Acidoferrum sp.]|nr:tyrosine-type recombinase/integrase [Candidatus Acidoferrum sp.]